VLAGDIRVYARVTETRHADGAIVLGAGVFGDQPSPVLRERINHAVGLYQRGYVDAIIFTGGQGRAGEFSEADVARRYARAQNVPDEAILVEQTSANTVENLTNAQQIASEQGLESLLIVSTPFHMKRAMSIASDLDMEAYSSPTRTTEWISWLTKSRAFAQEVVSYMLYLIAKPF
jgi:uncharacterized SAM-binding protein YcdF (DUF218 family)